MRLAHAYGELAFLEGQALPPGARTSVGDALSAALDALEAEP